MAEQGSERKIKFAIIGCGVIAPTHAEAIAASPNAELVACADIVEDKARKFAEERGIRWWRDYEEMLEKDDEIEAVTICTPSGMHHQVAIAAAQAGKHILCEKPLDITLKAIDDMIAAAEENNVKLGCIFQNRTYPSSRKIREAVRTGKLGKLVLGDCYQKYFRSHEYYASGEWRATWELDGGGALMNQGVHGIDLLIWIMGNVKRVNAQCRTLVRNIYVEDTAVAIVEFENRALGTIEGTTSVTPGYGMRLEISGDDGTIKYENGKIVAWDIPGEEGAEVEAETGGRGTAASPTEGLTATGHAFLVQDLCEAIIYDRDPYITGPDARRSVELIKAIYLSSRLGGDTVELPLSYDEDGPGIYPPLERYEW